MPSLIIQPASHPIARQHYEDTVVNPVELDQISPHLDYPTIELLKNIYKGEEFPVWGFTPNNKGKWNRVESGDVVLFLRDKHAFASATVSFKIHSPKLAEALWGYDVKGHTWEYVYFLDEIQSQEIEYKTLNTLLEYGMDNNFQQSLVRSDEKSEKLIAQLDLGSGLYETAPSREAYLNAVEPSEDVALDKLITTKARTEQSYLRYVNFQKKKYAKCGICNLEYPISFLVAAHIKRRTECTQEERRDFDNITMPMCRFGCDELYEKGYLGVDDGVVVTARDRNLTVEILSYLDRVKGNGCEYWNDSTSVYFAWHNARMKLAI